MLNGHVPCVNPVCQRIFSIKAEEQAEGFEICCWRCWRQLPAVLTRRFRQLKQRRKAVLSRLRKRGPGGVPAYDVRQAQTLRNQLDRLAEANWHQIRMFFRPADKPAGLNLEELG